MKKNTLAPKLLKQMNAYWRSANYLSVGQIYLYDNPLLKKPPALSPIKPRVLGHWGTAPGLNFLYVHLNRVIKEQDLNAICISGPGHGGARLVANAYLDVTYTKVNPDIAQDTDGIAWLFKQFSFPGGIPSHVAPEPPGSIHEGGELAYALSRAFGAAFDDPQSNRNIARPYRHAYKIKKTRSKAPHVRHEDLRQSEDLSRKSDCPAFRRNRAHHACSRPCFGAQQTNAGKARFPRMISNR